VFDLNQLRCFVTVAEELHFGRAAARLHMTQPPLSRQIQLIEHSVGTPLFSRTNRMVRLTPAGRSLLPEAHAILRLAEKARLSALRTGLGEAGRIVIGFTATAADEFLPDMLGRLRRTLPGIDLELREMVSSLQLDALENGQLDVGLLRRGPADREDLDSVCVARETLVAALPLDHPLGQRNGLHLRDFDGQAMVMYSPRFRMRSLKRSIRCQTQSQVDTASDANAI
jgi:DNA-binding transcriptional LysR family regulator